MKALLLNARSIKGKLTELQALSFDYDLICITETHLDPSFPNSLIFDSTDKVIYRVDRNLNGGGVLIALNAEIEHSPIDIDTEGEIVCVEVNDSRRKYSCLVVCVYRPPSNNTVDPIYNCLNYLKSKYPSHKTLLVGDFNLPNISWNSDITPSDHLSRKFLNLLDEFHLTQKVDQPTHIRGNILDLVCTDIPVEPQNLQIIKPGLSDHYSISVIIDFNFNLPMRNIIIKDYRKADEEGFSAAMDQLNSKIVDMVENCDSIDSIWFMFKSSLLALIDTFVPKVEKKIKTNEPVWFNRNARKACKKQRKLYNKAKITQDWEAWEQYQLTRKSNKKLFRKLKRDYMLNTIYQPMSSGNNKAFYSYLRKSKSESTNMISKLLDQSGQVVTSRKEIANTLNLYFQSVFTSKTPPSGTLEEHLPTDAPELITVNGVLKLLKDLKKGKAPGPDQITRNDLCLDINATASILCTIFNYSVAIGCIPNDWRDANITPIFKSGDRLLASNYRPISLTCICCKLLEHIINHWIRPHLDSILSVDQHGFRRHMSCTTQLCSVVHDIAFNIDKGLDVQAAVLDFSKAFDKVPHVALLEKMKTYGFDTCIVKWISSFLKNRRQRVVIEGIESNFCQVLSGVPQGSVLGPTLFLVYINDITSCINYSTIKLFADDTLLYLPLSDNNSHHLFQQDLNNLNTWAQAHGMNFNTSKSLVICFSKNLHKINQHPYYLDKVLLKNVTDIKYLGVILTQNLSWENHINYTTKKAYKVFGLLKHVLYDAPVKLKCLAYKILCRPILEYASEVWDPYQRNQCYKLEQIQNKAIRFIGSLKGRDVSITENKKKFNIETLEVRRKSGRVALLMKILEHPTLFSNLNDFYNSMLPSHPQNTRSHASHSTVALSINTNIFRQSFLPRTTRELRLGPEPNTV